MNRQEEGQAIGGQYEEVIEETERVTIAVHERSRPGLHDYMPQLKSLVAAASHEKLQRTWPKIQKVPPLLRENEQFVKHYEPKILPIGPIHHKSAKLQHSEKLKWRLAGQFIKKFGLLEEKLWFDLMKEVPNLKEYYDDGIVESYRDEDLTWMFLVDGCAILSIIIYVAGRGFEVENLKEFASELDIKNDQVAFVQRDMFLLENQIPYRVLKVLTSSISLQGKDGAAPISIDDIIEEFIHRNMMMVCEKSTRARLKETANQGAKTSSSATKAGSSIVNHLKASTSEPESRVAGASTAEPEFKIIVKEGERNEAEAEGAKHRMQKEQFDVSKLPVLQEIPEQQSGKEKFPVKKKQLASGHLPQMYAESNVQSRQERPPTPTLVASQLHHEIHPIGQEPPRPPQQQQSGEEKPRTFHLLHLLREKLVAEPKLPEMSFCQRLRGSLKCGKNRNEDGKLYSFRSVTELRTSGIWLKPSRTSLLKDVEFDRIFVGTGTLKLPPVIVDDSTGPKFLNLIAYEMCPDFKNNFEVTSYVCFIDSLIDSPEDVKELRKAHILHNLMGSDEEVAKLFNEIGTDLVSHPDAYRKVMGKIERHSQSKITVWMAQFYHTHFSTPWTMIAFLAAVIALVLTGVQTYYALFPKK